MSKPHASFQCNILRRDIPPAPDYAYPVEFLNLPIQDPSSLSPLSYFIIRIQFPNSTEYPATHLISFHKQATKP